MKKTLRRLGLIILVLLVGLTPIACKKESRYGTMTVGMTDAPAGYKAVNVDIVGMEVNHEHGWMAVKINQGVYNLLELRNNVSVVLANNVSIPPGKINQLRLILGSNNSVVDITGTQYPLTVPSGSETGLKINVNEIIGVRKHIEILLDFDADASIVVEGNGRFSLKPVIKVKSVVQ